MPDYRAIYAHHAALYQQLVSREDYRARLAPALGRLPGPALDGATVVELGAGTGRLTRLLAPRARRIWAVDASPAMLAVARRATTAGRVHYVLADNRRLPCAGGAADLALAGWSLGHLVGWYPDSWATEIGAAVAEMQRVIRPGGTAVIIETLGTNRTTPRAPHAGLAAYYRWLSDQAFSRTWIRTDYRFASLAEAQRLIRFFFGDDMAAQISSPVVPECTGIWWRQARQADSAPSYSPAPLLC